MRLHFAQLGEKLLHYEQKVVRLLGKGHVASCCHKGHLRPRQDLALHPISYAAINNQQ